MALPGPLRALVDQPGRAALFLDYDGSLAPIVTDPTRTRALPAGLAALARLVPALGRVAIVSGRPAAFLRDALGVEGLQYVGAYGLERIVEGQVVVDERTHAYADAVARAAAEAETALPGLRVERKGQVSVTVHWREQPEHGAKALAWAEAAASRLGLAAPLQGRMAVELRPPLGVDKGTVVTSLAAGFEVAAFAGDDAGDVAAFAALRALEDAGALACAVSIGVASAESPPEISAADVVVDGPRGLATVLDELADAISARA